MRFHWPDARFDAFYKSYTDCLGSQHSRLGIGDTKSAECLLDSTQVLISGLMSVCLTLSITNPPVVS